MKVRMTSKSIFRGKKFEKAHECAIKYYINKAPSSYTYAAFPYHTTH